MTNNIMFDGYDDYYDDDYYDNNDNDNDNDNIDDYNLYDNNDNISSNIDRDVNLRNLYLFNKYKKIPSYCIWTVFDVKKESLRERYNWWLSIQKENNNEKVIDNTIINSMLESIKELSELT